MSFHKNSLRNGHACPGYRLFLCACALALAGRSIAAAEPLERVTFRDDSKMERSVAGRVLTEAADGGLLVQGQDGRLWRIEKEQLASRESMEAKFAPLVPEALGRQLAEELGVDCEIVVTRHYVICSRAGKPYAQWCGALFERLESAFQNYWKQRGVKLREPEFPLIALVFADEKQFAAFATKDAGPDVAAAKGYFSIGTNRIFLYDLTATGNEPARSGSDISRRLAASPFNIATVVHEATHQIAFNSGMHTRYADNPLWLTEGMAMFFETPDLSSRTGWKTIGAVNDLRLKQFRAYSARRPADSLLTLLQSDARFTDAAQMGDAYAEAWALSHFLIKTRKEAYVAYLNRLAEKPRLVWDQPQKRLTEFRAAFGDDLQQLDAEFVKYVRRLK
jgi:Protein of unknown function (DUF1570)